jgi:hypothetical protein
MQNVDAKDVVSSSEPSDLESGGEGQINVASRSLVVGTPSPYHSESETTATDDDTKQLIGNVEKKKKSPWTGVFTFKKKKVESEDEEDASKSLALQEDSSVSSWSRGGDSSPDASMNLYGKSDQSDSDNMPPEMKAFGEDHGLAAAEIAMEEEERKKNGNDSEGELSEKSSGSLRDELDRAIETGDWAEVQMQTEKMFVDGEESQNESGDISDADSDVDTSGLEGWSNDNRTDDESELIDDERIEILEKLIETDDWQGIVDNSQIHTNADDSVVVDDNEEE